MRSSAFLAAALWLAACGKGDEKPAPQPGPPVGPGAPAQPAPPTGPRKFEPPPPERQCQVDVISKGDGREVKKGDIVMAHFVYSLDTGKKLLDTHDQGEPQPLEAGAGYTIPALDQALLKMRVGDHWKIHAPYPLAWGEQGYPPVVPPKADVVLDVEVVGFLEIKTEVVKEGAGLPPIPGDYVMFHSVGSMPDGRVFEDTRSNGAPRVETVGSGQMIQGLEVTLRRMKVGDRVKITVPWRYAFGATGRPPVVPPKADVNFDVERMPMPEVKTEVVKEGKGAPCVAGSQLSVHYAGTLAADGKPFDDSRSRGQPYTFTLWARPPQVIAGWEIALRRMRVGDRWKVTIPWQLAYGVQGKPPTIPSKADLVFDMEVVDVK